MHDGHNAPFLAGRRMRLLRIASLLLAVSLAAPAHAVVTTAQRATEIVGTGGTVFTVPFPFADAASLVVNKVLISTGAATLLVIGADYTVTLPVGSVSGRVTTSASVSSPFKLRIERVTPLTQTTSLGSQGAFYPALHEKAFDKLTMAAQDIAATSGGSDSANTPTTDQKAALVGTSGSPSASNKYVTDADPRNTNARTPSLHASSHASGGSDPLTGTLDANGRLQLRLNSAGSVSTRRRFNLIAGSNVTLSQSDDAVNEEVDITISAAGGGGGGLGDGDYGDITISGASTALTVDADVVNNAKLANMANATFKCRVTASTGDPEDCTATQATSIFNLFSSSLKGLAPASGGGTTNFLRADGGWNNPVTGSAINTALGGVGLSFTGAASTPGAVITGGSGTADGIQSNGVGGGAGLVGFGGSSSGTGAAGIGGGPNGTGIVGSGSGSGAGVNGSANSSSGIGVLGGGFGSGPGVVGQGGNSGGTGGQFTGGSTSGYGAVVQADTTSPVNAALRLVPQDADPTGPNAVGDIYVTTAGVVKACTVAGTPGTWASIAGASCTDSDKGDITTSSSCGTWTIDAATITLAKMANLAQDQVIGRVTASTGVPETFTVTSAARSVLDDTSVANMRATLGAASGSGSASGTNTGDQTITGTGDVTGSGTGSIALTIAADAVSNAKLADMNAHTFKGNNTGSAANPADLTATQLTAELNAMVGDSGSGGTKGLVPAPATGDATKCLSGAGSYVTCSGGSSGPLWQKYYAANMWLPVGTSWPTTAMADFETFNLVDVISFDPTTSQGRGFEVVLPTGATTITVDADGAAAASGFTSNNGLVFALDCRQQYGTGSFTQQTATAVTLTDNATIQRKSFAYTVSGLSATAGTVLLCEWERLTANGSDTMTQDWRVPGVMVTVN